jgi:hypothetical protein
MSRVFHPDHKQASGRDLKKVHSSAAVNSAAAPKTAPAPSLLPAYQGGPAVEIFTCVGQNPTANSAVKGSVLRSFERGIKGYAYSVEAPGAGSRLQLPKDAAKGLGLTQRFLALQVC